MWGKKKASAGEPSEARGAVKYGLDRRLTSLHNMYYTKCGKKPDTAQKSHDQYYHKTIKRLKLDN
jgi:hypothetical protein